MTNLERAKNLEHCRICKFEEYVYHKGENIRNYWEHISEIPEGEQASLGDLKNTDDLNENCYLTCELMEGSNYSNGRIIQESNQKAFLKEFENTPGVHETYGEYSSFGIAVQIKHLTDEMFGIFEKLKDYTVLDENLISEMELDQQNEAWKYWIESDFEKELERNVEVEILDRGAKFQELFLYAAEHANEYWFEDGCSQYIHVGKVAEVCTEELLTKYGVKYATPEN